MIPENLDADLPMQLFARNVKSFRVIPHNGDDWTRDGWDTGKLGYRNLYPHMVKVYLDVWISEYDPDAGESSPVNTATTGLAFVSNLALSAGTETVKGAKKGKVESL